MPSARPRLVRRQSLAARLQAWLNPMDMYLWICEEIQTLDWDSKAFGTRFGLVANFLFLLARANTGGSTAVDDVFADAPNKGWAAYFAHPLVWFLGAISLVNAFYTMTRQRHYRLFEANVEQAGPSTPSAHRVRVDSSPASSSPMRYLQDMLGADSAEARAHPDPTRDVWEIAVWDPFPATLRIFCLFSPGHVLVHMLFLPLVASDPRPSATVLKCVVLQAILSVQLLLLQDRFGQQARDTAVIQREVMHEYDTKYVHPRLHPLVREASTQISTGENGAVEVESVAVGTPSTLIRRGFRTNPNQNYVKHFDPDGAAAATAAAVAAAVTSGVGNQQLQQQRHSNVMSPGLFTPLANKVISRSAGMRQSMPATSPLQAQLLAQNVPSNAVSTSTGTSTRLSDVAAPGGYLGVYQHINSPLKHSPLKKATSMGDMKNGGVPFSPRNSREMAAIEQRELAEKMIREKSPLKNDRRATTQFGPDNQNPFAQAKAQQAQQQAKNPFVRPRHSQERFPSLR